MKRLFAVVITSFFLLSFTETTSAQSMSDYCSAPPYVTRSIPPNVMILMDNSKDMLGPAYTDNYDPTTLTDPNKKPYDGYYNPGGCYIYDQNEFKEVLKLDNSVTPNLYKSYTASDTCPSSATGWLPNNNWTSFTSSAGPFRGNLLNWATMSKFDILQKVLIGGNAASKQGNAHTLISISGNWNDGNTADGEKTNNTYNGCVFKVNNGNLTISETSAGSCTLLDSPATPIAFWKYRWWDGLLARIFGGLKGIYSSLSDGVKKIFASAAELWEKITIIAKAWAASACGSITVASSLNGVVNDPYALVLEASGCNSCTFTWTLTTDATWLSTTPACSETATKKTCGRATFSGTPTAVGTYTFTATATSDGCTGTMTKSGTISITATTLTIITASIPGGQINVPYTFTMQGQGGITPYNWSVYSGSLPPVLSLSSAGVISGTPTTAGTYTVQIQLSDSYSGNDPDPFTAYTITITPPTLSIATSCPLPNALFDRMNSYQLTGSGGTTPYTWSITSGSLPIDMYLCTNQTGCDITYGGTPYHFNNGTIYGDPKNNTAGTTFNFTVTLRDSSNPQLSVSKACSITVIRATALTIITTSLPDAVKGQAYSFTMQGAGGTTPYTWSATGLPASLTIDPATGVISGTPAQSEVGTYTVTIMLRDAVNTTVTKQFTLNVLKAATTRSQSFNVKVELMEEPFTDMNGNDIYDGYPETFTPDDDKNGNGVWDGKKGIFQQFWDANNPRARWGLADFSKQGNTVSLDIDSCIPAAPASSFYTRIQNATPTENAPLATGLYGVVNYYKFSGTGYRGCSNSDPIDDVPCRKNFVLIITSGSDVSGTNFSQSDCTSLPHGNSAMPLVQNACYAYKNDLRPTDRDGKQILYTYVVNTMGTANNDILEDAARAGDGKYYYADSSGLSSQLTRALQDILAQAASGTAVSVLTTSSRGVGSVVQAYFLPTTQEGNRDVWWTGYLQNLWIDPQDNLREDTDQTGGKIQLELDKDKVIKLFFNSTSNETEAALFTTNADGQGGTLGSCGTPERKVFSKVNPLWEAGKKLAIKNAADRKIFTSTKVNREFTTTHTFTTGFLVGIDAPEFKIGMAQTLSDALVPEGAYTADNIIKYVRGEDLETGDPANFRDRRLTIGGSLYVWKLGDIISSTPRVLGTGAQNTYDTRYGDITYSKFIGSSAVQQRSSLAIVGGNDGMLHAFRVGYLKDTGFSGTVKAIFRNFFGSSDTDNALLGDEVWAYIPFNAFPYLKYLEMTDYCHLYFNDLSVRLEEAAIGVPPSASKDQNDWRTILIGGMRFGGACGGTPANPPTGTPANVGYSAFFAIDVTDPEHPLPLWEFSAPDLGYTESVPTIIRTGPKDIVGNWYAVIGSGSQVLPKSSPYGVDIGRGTEGYIYILDLKTGDLVKKIGLGHNAIVGDITAVDADTNYDSERIYFGTSYYDTSAAKWKGKIMRIFFDVQDLSTYTPKIKTLFSGDYPFTVAPDALKDSKNNVWIYFGSGKYYSDLDEQDLSQQIFFGFIDPYSGNDTDPATYVREGPTTAVTWPSTCPADTLCNVTDYKTTGVVGKTDSVCAYNKALDKFTVQQIVTQISSNQTKPTTSIGWKIYLPSRQRVISNPVQAGGLVDFLTYKPNDSLCAYGGESYLWSVEYSSGTAPSILAIRAPGATVDSSGNTQTSGEVIVSNNVLLGPGAPPTGEAIQIPPQKDGKLKKKIQIATGVIVEAENKTIYSEDTKIIHWLKK